MERDNRTVEIVPIILKNLKKKFWERSGVHNKMFKFAVRSVKEEGKQVLK